MRAELIACAELLRDFHRELLFEASLHVKQDQLVQSGSRFTRKLPHPRQDRGYRECPIRLGVRDLTAAVAPLRPLTSRGSFTAI